MKILAMSKPGRMEKYIKDPEFFENLKFPSYLLVPTMMPYLKPAPMPTSWSLTPSQR